jgi:hypothetical protein
MEIPLRLRDHEYDAAGFCVPGKPVVWCGEDRSTLLVYPYGLFGARGPMPRSVPRWELEYRNPNDQTQQHALFATKESAMRAARGEWVAGRSFVLYMRTSDPKDNKLSWHVVIHGRMPFTDTRTDLQVAQPVECSAS